MPDLTVTIMLVSVVHYPQLRAIADRRAGRYSSVLRSRPPRSHP